MYLIDYIAYGLHLWYGIEMFKEMCRKRISQHPDLGPGLQHVFQYLELRDLIPRLANQRSIFLALEWRLLRMKTGPSIFLKTSCLILFKEPSFSQGRKLSKFRNVPSEPICLIDFHIPDSKKLRGVPCAQNPFTSAT